MSAEINEGAFPPGNLKSYKLSGLSPTIGNVVYVITVIKKKLYFFKNIYLFIYFWLHRVLVAACGIFVEACGIFRCGTWALHCGAWALRCGVQASV